MLFSKKLEKIQNSPESVKIRWLIALSAITILITLIIWVAYVKNLIQSSSGNLLEPTQNDDPPGWLQNLRLKTANTIFYFRQKFSQENKIILERPNHEPGSMNQE